MYKLSTVLTFVRGRLNVAVISLVAATLLAAPILAAGKSPQPVEWETYIQGRRTYSLGSYWLQRDCKQAGRWADYDWKVRINANQSWDPDRYRIYSGDRTMREVFGGKAPMGVDLLSSSPAICIGVTDALRAGGISNVRSKMFSWIK